MRKIIIGAVSTAAILSAGFLANPAEAMIGAPAGVGLAAEAVAPVENVWCHWRCRHHRFIVVHRFHRFHHRPVFFVHRRCWWGGWC